MSSRFFSQTPNQRDASPLGCCPRSCPANRFALFSQRIVASFPPFDPLPQARCCHGDCPSRSSVDPVAGGDRLLLWWRFRFAELRLWWGMQFGSVWRGTGRVRRSDRRDGGDARWNVDRWRDRQPGHRRTADRDAGTDRIAAALLTATDLGRLRVGSFDVRRRTSGR